jgi:hypothetical protein
MLAEWRWLLVAVLSLAAAPAAAQDVWGACARAITAAERGSGIPPGLMLAIARVESGRARPRSGENANRPGGGVSPWPFAINADGSGRFPETREAAVAEVEGLRARGINSVDVGCMQVNLFHHPDAFPSLEAAFDPPTNVAYAARFLRELRARTGNWAEAVAQYHSSEPGRGLAYHSRVTVSRVAGGVALGGARNLAALCAAGLRPRVVVAPNGRSRVACGR